MDETIRPLTIAEQAIAAARLTVQTGEQQPNPYASADPSIARKWDVCFMRAMAMEQSCSDCEGGA